MGCGAGAEYPPPQAPPPPPPAPVAEPATAPEPYTQGTPSAPPSDSGQSAPPPPLAPPPSQAPPAPSSQPPTAAPSAPLVYTYPTGQWVYMAGRGWVWVPAGTTPQEVDGAPYVYLYTPAYGWTWYLSPWGWGPYYYGVWVGHPWHPVGWHGYWIAHPRVVQRLGGRGRR
jgi:hypothetical protein